MKKIKTGIDELEYAYKSSEFIHFLTHNQILANVTAIDILPSKYTEVKKRYWSKV